MSRVLIYAHDPMCSWCWAFRPTWEQVTKNLPDDIVVKLLLGGLAPDSQDPMPTDMQKFLQDTWRTIQQQVPGTQFNFDFWLSAKPRRSTYPACRAVVAARLQADDYVVPMIRAIQEAYYLQARNPSDDVTLVELAHTLGLDKDRFAKDLVAKNTQAELVAEIDQCRALGLNGFPSLALLEGDRVTRLRHDYNNAQLLLDQLVA